jgi:hypothetical protein
MAHATTTAINTDHSSLISTITHSPVFWSSTVMITIVTLLYVWDECVEWAREEAPPLLVPVIEKVLGEIGSIGFIGLFLSTILGKLALGNVVGEISEEFLGEEELLLETFEFLHEAFFQVAILFFVAASVILVRILQEIQQVTTLAEATMGGTIPSAKNCDETAESLANILDTY